MPVAVGRLPHNFDQLKKKKKKRKKRAWGWLLRTLNEILCRWIQTCTCLHKDAKKNVQLWAKGVGGFQSWHKSSTFTQVNSLKRATPHKASTFSWSDTQAKSCTGCEHYNATREVGTKMPVVGIPQLHNRGHALGHFIIKQDEQTRQKRQSPAVQDGVAQSGELSATSTFLTQRKTLGNL